MKTIYLFFLTLALALPGLLISREARGQETGPQFARPEFTNCFPNRPQRRGSNRQPAARPQSGSSNYGGAVTPQGRTTQALRLKKA